MWVAGQEEPDWGSKRLRAQGSGHRRLGFRVQGLKLGVGFFQVRLPDSFAEDHPEP